MSRAVWQLFESRVEKGVVRSSTDRRDVETRDTTFDGSSIERSGVMLFLFFLVYFRMFDSVNQSLLKMCGKNAN
jgi:hypothetical protein